MYMAAMMTLLATANIVPVRDAHGNEIIPELRTTGRLVRSVNLAVSCAFKIELTFLFIFLL